MHTSSDRIGREWRLRTGVVGILLLLLVSTPPARADAGTPLMWAEGGHLLIGNAIIGVVEGLVIAVLFRVRKRAAMLWMIGANYASMLLGVFLFNSFGPAHLRDYFGDSAPTWLTLHSAVAYHVVGIIVLLALTAVVEWPFCVAMLWRQPRWLLRSVGACAMAQCVSYALLCSCYVPPSAFSVLTETQLAEPAVFAKTCDAWIYYVSPSDGDLWRIHPDGADRTRVCAARIKDRAARLFVRPAEEGSGWDLWWRSGRWNMDEQFRLLADFASCPARPEHDWESIYEDADFCHDGHCTYLDQSPSRNWRVQVYADWPDNGLRALKARTGERLHLAMATPLLRWTSSNATMLPGDQVVYQLGDQIVLLDLNERKLGLITLGRGPVVVQGEPSAPGALPTAPCADFPTSR